MDIAKNDKERGRNLYSSAINFFFESRIDCSKDLLMYESKLDEKAQLSQVEKDIENHLKEILYTLWTWLILRYHRIKEEIEKGINLFKSFLNGNVNSNGVQLDCPNLKWI